MSVIALKTTKTVDDYCDGIKKLMFDIKEEIENEIKDGIGIKLASQDGDEASVYNFLKNQGYEMTYKDFTGFYEDSLKIVDENEQALERIMQEQISEELSDNDLEEVSGGKGWWKKNWKKVALGVGIGLVVAAATVLTCGVAGAAMAGAAATATGMTAATASAVSAAATAGYIAAGLATVGIGSIVASTIE